MSNVEGVNSASFMIVSTPSAVRSSLSRSVSAWIAASWAPASASPIGSGITQDETRLPSFPFSSALRTLTGAETRKVRLLGSTPRSTRYSRTAPVTTVSTTSLIVQSNARRMAFRSASGTRHQSKRRCGPTGPFSGVWSADSPMPSIWTTARRRVRTSVRTSSVSSEKRRRSRAMRNGVPSERNSSPRTSSSRLGEAFGTKGGGGSNSGTSGEIDIRICERSMPEAPSIMQWWVLLISAKRSPPSRPSTTQISQSGRARSSCCDMMRADQPLELRGRARLRQRGVADVVVEVEARVVDPDRVLEAGCKCSCWR